MGRINRGLKGEDSAWTFLSELVWREFSYVLLYHNPEFGWENYDKKFDNMPWKKDAAALERWQKGQTGYPIVDAGMRQLWATGWMHNRVRMIVASLLTKHLLMHWRDGEDWFWDTLVDADPASNAAGWQWVAGSGPDAAPYFRVFNPETQAEKFDPDRAYIRRWIAEGQKSPPESARDYFEAIPRSWNMAADGNYPDAPIVGLKEGREAALEAYQNRTGSKEG